MFAPKGGTLGLHEDSAPARAVKGSPLRVSASNAGMQDAPELNMKIIARKDDFGADLKASIAAATKELELEMWPHAKPKAEKT